LKKKLLMFQNERGRAWKNIVRRFEACVEAGGKHFEALLLNKVS